MATHLIIRCMRLLRRGKHIRSSHPDLVGRLTDDELLEMVTAA